MTLDIDVFRSSIQKQFRAFALAATAIAGMSSGAIAASRHHHSITHHRVTIQESAFNCAVHTAFGEAPAGDIVEAAVIINGLVKSARKDGISICAESFRRYAPRYGSPAWAVRAATNVFNQGASFVPPAFRNVTEFRSAKYPLLRNRHFILVGQLSRSGNRFYEPIL